MENGIVGIFNHGQLYTWFYIERSSESGNIELYQYK